MNDTAVIFACSHRAGGNSDHGARLLAQGVEEAGGRAEIVAVRDFEVLPCLACQACQAHPEHHCVLARKDQAEELFDRLNHAPVVYFSSPIYFYHLPSRFKTWIDRGQRFWAMRQDALPGQVAPALLATTRLAHVALVSGRPRGEKLFEGALVTLKFFLANFGIILAEPLLLRGKDEPGDLAADGGAETGLIGMGRRGWEKVKAEL